MKKFSILFIAVAAVIFSATNNVSAQVSHSKYVGTAELFQSMINLSNPRLTTNQIWLVATDRKNFLTIIQTDGASPTPQPLNTWVFQPTTAHGQIYLRSGFFDSQGNIFVYGYEQQQILPYQYQERGFFAKITFSGGTPSSVVCRLIDVPNTAITDACWADTHQNSIINPINYGIIYGNQFDGEKFLRINGGTGQFGISNLGKKIAGGDLTSVNYDKTVNKFVVTGNDHNNSKFIATIDNDANGNNTGRRITSPSNNIYMGTGKHILSGNEQWYNGIAYWVQDIYAHWQEVVEGLVVERGGLGFWVTEFNYLTLQVISSNLYCRSTSEDKITVIDVAHNGVLLYILGHRSYPQPSGGVEGRYLAQIDLFNPSNYTVLQMSDTSIHNTEEGDYTRVTQAYLHSLNINLNSFNVYASGAMSNGDGYLVEGLDLSELYCDEEIEFLNLPVTFSISNITLEPEDIRPPLIPITYQPFSNSVNSSLICTPPSSPEKNAELKAKIEAFMAEKKAQHPLLDTEKATAPTPKGEIEVMHRQFVCKNFEGTCEYAIYDVLGRVLQQGTTQNGSFIDIKTEAAGVYIIRVTDETNKAVNKKITLIK